MAIQDKQAAADPPANPENKGEKCSFTEKWGGELGWAVVN